MSPGVGCDSTAQGNKVKVFAYEHLPVLCTFRGHTIVQSLRGQERHGHFDNCERLLPTNLFHDLQLLD